MYITKFCIKSKFLKYIICISDKFRFFILKYILIVYIVSDLNKQRNN